MWSEIKVQICRKIVLFDKKLIFSKKKDFNIYRLRHVQKPSVQHLTIINNYRQFDENQKFSQCFNFNLFEIIFGYASIPINLNFSM